MSEQRLTPEATFIRPQDMDTDLVYAYYISFGLDDLHPDDVHQMLLAHETQPAIASQYLAEALRKCQARLDKLAEIITRRLLAPTTDDGALAS